MRVVGVQPLCTFPSVNQVFSQSVHTVCLRPWFEHILCVVEGFVPRCPVTPKLPAHPEHAGRGWGIVVLCGSPGQCSPPGLPARAQTDPAFYPVSVDKRPAVWMGFFSLFLRRVSNRIGTLKMTRVWCPAGKGETDRVRAEACLQEGQEDIP